MLRRKEVHFIENEGIVVRKGGWKSDILAEILNRPEASWNV